MRARHRLRMDEPDDFDMMTADSVLKFLEQFTRAIVLALVVISSIALMVGGIGVMAIMTISVTERTREIGVRKALGARRREILVQFLIEAVFLTSLGGMLGIMLGAGIGYGINVFAGFPVRAAALVVRRRRRLLGHRRHPLRDAAGREGLQAGSDRGLAVRIAAAFVIRPSAFAKARRQSCSKAQGRWRSVAEGRLRALVPPAALS